MYIREKQRSSLRMFICGKDTEGAQAVQVNHIAQVASLRSRKGTMSTSPILGAKKCHLNVNSHPTSQSGVSSRPDPSLFCIKPRIALFMALSIKSTKISSYALDRPADTT